jgi:hypothetical protein
MRNNRAIWLIVLSTVLFFGAAFVTLRAAEQAGVADRGTAGGSPAVGLQSRGDQPGASPPVHPAPSAPEESATISDDPTTAPDPSQSADNNVSFPTDI